MAVIYICLLKLVILFIIYNVNLHGNPVFSLVYTKVTFLSVTLCSMWQVVFLSPSGGSDNLFVLTLWSGWQICFSVTLWSGWQLVCPHTLEWMILCSSVVCHLLERVTILMFSWVATGSVLKVSKNVIGLTAILIIMSFFTFKTDIILCIKISIILSINIVFLCVLHCRADMWGSLCQRLCYRHIIFNLQPVLQHIEVFTSFNTFLLIM